jgi:DNA helicase II / ATP-dependent DNA helicase PcrA
MAVPGPPELGRGVVVLPRAVPPAPWDGCPRVVIDHSVLDDPAAALATLQDAWFARRPLVVELAVDSKVLQERESSMLPVHDLSPRFEFALERLHFLVWANNYDARNGAPIWWHGRKALRSFATQGIEESETADIELADGTPLWVDGGPFAPTADAGGFRIVHRWNTEAGSLSPVGHHAPEADLAADQAAAVSHPAGGARVIAPAGSGKTRVLTERLRYLLEERGAAPSSVTALAYNKKAADELQERCGALVTSRGPHIRTLNSVGLSICNEFGGPGRLDVLEEPRVRDLVQQIFEVRRQANTDTVLPYIDALSAVRLGLTPPAAVEEQIPDASGLAEGFGAYREALLQAGAVDFDEQIYRAIEILLRNPEARSAAQARCRHLLVDEFQDLNPAHMLLIRLLSAPTYDIFGVGDDDQVIYGYAGATPEYLINFKDYFAGARAYALEVNYRCPPAVVTAATHVLSYNTARIAKAITTPSGSTDALPAFGDPLREHGPVAVIDTDAELMAQTAVSAVSAWRDAGVAPDEIAVLSRVNSTLLPVQVALSEAGIPSNAPLSVDVLRRTGIATTFAYLRMGLSPEAIRREDIAQTIRRPSRGIAPNVTEMLSERSMTSVHDIRRLAGRLSGRDVSKLTDYADSIDAVVKACRDSSAAAVRAVRTDVGLGETMDVLDSSRRGADRSTHADDLLALESLAALHPDVASFEPWLRAALGRRPPEGPSVHLSTVHKIKGREWEHVIVYGASKGLFPHRLSDDGEGERRVFHVALTRAIRQVLVLADARDPSPFVAELDGSRAHTPVLRARREARAPGEASASRSTTLLNKLRGQSQTGRRGARATPPRPLPTTPVVTAEVGLAFEHGGHVGTVVELAESAAIIEVGSARLRVPYGTEVRVQATTMQLVSPEQGADSSDPAETYVQALREWRSTAAKSASVPAYVVLNDAELVGIATTRPTTLAELAQCKGVGPVRLERWGDELLAALDGAEGDGAGAGATVTEGVQG